MIHQKRVTHQFEDTFASIALAGLVRSILTNSPEIVKCSDHLLASKYGQGTIPIVHVPIATIKFLHIYF
jgi:hypothetical protein